VSDCPLQDNKELQNFGLSNSHTLNSNSDVSSQPPASGLNTGRSTSGSNLQHVSPVEIESFAKAEALTETRRQKTYVGAVLIDTPMKDALEAEVEAHGKPLKCNRLFSNSQEKS
jgi:hypothetical protein